MKKIIEKDILSLLPQNIKASFEHISNYLWNEICEIRLRAGQYPSITIHNEEQSLNEILKENSNGSTITQEDISRTLGLMSQNSIYAVQEEIKSGYITLKGGHRVGITGKVICNAQAIQNIKYFCGLNIRISRQVIGASDILMDYIISNGNFINTLIVSPPGCGKTTILRDAIRQLSNGISRLKYKGKTVGVVDERSELAACYKGIRQNDIGIRTDVLDNCPKAEGIMMMVRSMNPRIIATDEIGCLEDTKAIMTALSAGIEVICTAHGSSIEEIMLRFGLNQLLNTRVFRRIIILSNKNGPGTIDAIYDGIKLKNIYQKIKAV